MRIVRLSDGKNPIMVHLYFQDSRDQKWLERAGKNAVGVIKVDSVVELLEHINSK